MKNKKLEGRLTEEITNFMQARKTCQLATMTPQNTPYASYAPFAISNEPECLYVLVSDIAMHGQNLKHCQDCGVLIVEDESDADTIFARIRVHYQMKAELIERDTPAFEVGVNTLSKRHGSQIDNLSKLADFNLFRLLPLGGRYVKGFGQAFNLAGGTLTGESIEHLRDGHKPIEEKKSA